MGSEMCIRDRAGLWPRTWGSKRQAVANSTVVYRNLYEKALLGGKREAELEADGQVCETCVDFVAALLEG